MKRLILNFLSIAICAVFIISCSCGNEKGQNSEGTQSTVEAEASEDSAKGAASDSTSTSKDITQKTNNMAFDIKSLPEEPIFNIVTTLGTIKIKLYSKTPLHRDNFVKLASENFFDGILFHRVINGFMIQTGDPLTKDESKASAFGTGGPGYTVPAEFIKEYYHKKGALAAARRGDAANPKKASSGSQFYLVQDEMNCMQLDDQYTVFGETLEGLDIIDKIASVETDRYDRPYENIAIISVLPEINE